MNKLTLPLIGSMLTKGTLEGLCRWTDLHSELLANISHREQEASRELQGKRRMLKSKARE